MGMGNLGRLFGETNSDMELLYMQLIPTAAMERIDPPYSGLEDSILTSMGWEIYSDFRSPVESCSLYRNPISGNYRVNASTPIKGRSISEMSEVLNSRFSGLFYATEYWPGVKAVLYSAKKEGDMAEFCIELKLPAEARYRNILRYVNKDNPDKDGPAIIIISGD